MKTVSQLLEEVETLTAGFAKLDEAIVIQDRIIETYKEGFEKMDAIELKDSERRIA